MKYLIIFTFLTVFTLCSSDEIVLIDDRQSTLSEVETLPDARLLDIETNNTINQNGLNCFTTEYESDSDIESLPDATIVEVIEIESESYTSDDAEIIVDSVDTDIDIDAIPDATIVESIPEQSYSSSGESISKQTSKQTIEINTTTDTSAAVINETGQPIQINDSNTSIRTTKQSDQNTSNIIIVKTLENDTEESNDENIHKDQIDFWKLLEQTLLNSSTLILKKYDIAVTRENMNIIKSGYYPNISLSYAGEYYHSFEKGDASISGSYYPSYSQYRDSLGVNVQYELYRFGATDIMMKISQKELDIIRTELALQEEEVSKKLLEYFRQALKSQEMIKYKEKMRLIRDTILQKKLRLYEVGKVAKVVIAKDELAMANLEREILKHKLDLKDAVKKMQILSNLNLDPDHIEFVMLEPKNCKTKNFEESMIAKNLQLQIEKKKHELELIEKDYLPGFYLDSGYRLYGADENNFLQTIENLERNSWNIGLSVKWNIFDGYKTNAKITRTKIELQQLLEKYRLAKIDFESRERKRELLKKTFDKILQAEYKIIDQTFQQEEMYARLQSAGQIDTIQLDYIQISKFKNELNFKLSVIDKIYETISSELII